MDRGMELMVVTVGFHSRSESMSSTDISQGKEPYAFANSTLSTGMPLNSDSYRYIEER